MGPNVPNLGVRANLDVTQSQIAATIAALLGEDFVKAEPKAAPALPPPTPVARSFSSAWTFIDAALKRRVAGEGNIARASL